MEYVLLQNYDWLNIMIKELSTIEFENNILQLQMHGIDSKIIDRMKREFYNIYPEKERQVKKADLPSLGQLRMMGLKINKPNKTTVKR